MRLESLSVAAGIGLRVPSDDSGDQGKPRKPNEIKGCCSGWLASLLGVSRPLTDKIRTRVATVL